MHAGGWCCMHVPACIMTLCERLLWDLLMWGKKHQCEGVRDKNRICLSGFLSVAVKLPLLMWQCLYYNWGWRAFLFIASAQFAATKCLVSKRTLVFSVTKKPPQWHNVWFVNKLSPEKVQRSGVTMCHLGSRALHRAVKASMQENYFSKWATGLTELLIWRCHTCLLKTSKKLLTWFCEWPKATTCTSLSQPFLPLTHCFPIHSLYFTVK